MKEAAYWHSEQDRVRCDLCPHRCLIKDGAQGFCGVRGNRNGKLYALTYGLIAAQAIDPVEKKPLYHFYPGHRTLSLGSVGCNLRCRHCQNWRISCGDATTGLHELQALPPEAAVQLALDSRCQSLVWTYNEPSVWYEYILASAPLAHKAGLKTIMVTAGMLNSQPLDDLLPHIDAYRLDIKGFSAEFYRWLTGIDCLDQVLANAVAAYRAGCHVEIVTNLIPGHNDDEAQLRELSRWIVENLSPQTPWHLTAYFPNHELKLASTDLDSLEKGVQIGRQSGLEHIFIGNVPGHNFQHSLCSGCGQLLIQRDGFKVRANRIVESRCPACGYFLKNYLDA
jgi:pyruvate formate lyase activating enzyme